jgi:citrate synthase
MFPQTASAHSPLPRTEDGNATLTIGEQSCELPIRRGTEGAPAIDITNLRSRTGYLSFDNGYANTASCESQITYIDGEKGILRYRGIPIEDFESRPNFIEVSWLLLFGRLPNREEYTAFSRELVAHADIDESMKNLFAGFPRTAPPMAILSAMINALSCFHQEFYELDDPSQFEKAAAQIISKVRTLAAFAFRRSNGLPYIYPDRRLPYVVNFLHMMFSNIYEQHLCHDAVADALSLFLILHADHEQNCSTSTVRMVGSSGANLFASCAAGVCALWGPLHGGANVAVIQMLEKMRDGSITPEEYVRLAKDKDSDVRLMGFGHRVYKTFDPRAKMLQRMCDRVLTTLGVTDPLLDLARKLEEIALTDSYFIDHNLYPNVDFYSGIILKAAGIPVNMFTVLFAMGRLPGWIAHWKEQNERPESRIARPHQLYTGNPKTPYVAAEGAR